MAFFSDLAGFNIHHVNFNLPYSEAPQIFNGTGSPQPFTYPGYSGSLGAFNYEIPSHDASYDSYQIIEGTTGSNADYLAGNGLVFGANGAITGGTMALFENNTSTADGYLMGGFSMKAADYSAAAQTAGTGDDIKLFNAQFTGNDLIVLQTGNDSFNAGNGADFIYDAGGRNTLSGGNGSDVIISSDGKDKLDGGAGNDILVGGAGNDSITGDAGNDTIWGGAGDDTLNGGAGQDHFVFTAGDGKATIQDFTVADDQLMFVGPTKMADLKITQHGLDTHVTFADITVVLTGVDHHTLTKADFNFHGDTNVEASLANFLNGWDYIS